MSSFDLRHGLHFQSRGRDLLPRLCRSRRSSRAFAYAFERTEALAVAHRSKELRRGIPESLPIPSGSGKQFKPDSSDDHPTTGVS